MAKKLSNQTRGRYLGLVRHAKRTVKAKAKKLCATKGMLAAIAFLKKHR